MSMTNAWSALFASRKFWVGMLSVTSTIVAVTLRALDKIPADALIPTILAVTSTGLGVIGSIAWEDSAAKGAGGRDAPPPAPVVQNASGVTVESPRIAEAPAADPTKP